MKKLPVIIASVSLLTVSIAPVFAQTTMTTTDVTPTATTALKQVARPVLKTMQAEAVDTLKDTVSKAKAAFRAKLALIKDEQKKSVVENIDNEIATVNQNRTDEMSHNLTKLSEILDRISSRSATAKAAGQNTTTVEKDITAAQKAISAAQAAVTAQAAKEYTINITTEKALRTSVMTTLAQFRKDIKATYQTVVTARDGVRVAALDLEKQKNLEMSETPAPTASDAAENK